MNKIEKHSRLCSVAGIMVFGCFEYIYIYILNLVFQINCLQNRHCLHRCGLENGSLDIYNNFTTAIKSYFAALQYMMTQLFWYFSPVNSSKLREIKG